MTWPVVPRALSGAVSISRRINGNQRCVSAGRMHALTLTSEEAAVADYYARAILKETCEVQADCQRFKLCTSSAIYQSLKAMAVSMREEGVSKENE